ncbi:zinc finger protein 804A isoform X1 [Pezoporus flaviventris]|uniref:zinc finger protein 804A isoform X1 n=1 Tax=Pezoporus flaviventris TaxID=889875 RepID=UPI002AB1A5A8|nr:zinc finger protein 804A isoform X1 [Pezoporus flaviventris]
MECYYIVISSAHLSNGHFRNIKGVFRGPLSKNGNKTLDYAEKKNTIAKALEDLKANFYCELCDKQYYKHQEFDNHINSYDHAHKQRLKELKQREFARNIASKSWKDEKKQEKALRRLHKLAELRKERTCAPGSGPMFKSTTVTVRDHCSNNPQSAITDSSNSQDLMHDTQNGEDVASVTSSIPGNACSNKSDTNKCGDQVQGAQGHRVGFSFAFPKKAVVKLESSAAVFYEYNDETSIEHGFSRRSRFVPGACNIQSPSVAEIVLCPEEKHNCFHPLVEKCIGTAGAPKAQEPEKLAGEESGVLESPILTPAASHSKHLVSLDMGGYGIDVNAADVVDQMLPMAVDSARVLPLDCSGYELQANRALAQAIVEDSLSLQDVAKENNTDSNSDPSMTETEIKRLVADVSVPSASEEGSGGTPQSKPDVHKRPCEPFVPVLSKHGSNILQWPSEMLIYTSTDPSISYSCNPLYFDFKLSRATDSQEKPKHQPNIPHLHHKSESNHSLVLNFTNKPTSECGDYEPEINKDVCDYTIPLISDNSLLINCDFAKNQNKVSLDESFRIRKIEKYRLSKNHLRQNTVIDEKYNKIWIKESHEKWLHKSRKWKRKRKLCRHHHHCGDMTAAEMEMSSMSEKEISYQDENKYQHLQNNPEKCRYDVGNIWLDAGELQHSHQKLGIENCHKRVMSAPHHVHGDRAWCDVWSATNNQHHGCKRWHRRSRASSQAYAKQLALSSRRHSLRYTKTCCSWKARRSSCSPEHKCLGHCSVEKSLSQKQSIKRGYSVLTEETKKSHCKWREHTCSSSSEESSYTQTLSAEEYLRQAQTIGTRHRTKGKQRKRKTRIHRIFLDRKARSENSRPSTESSANSTLNVLRGLLTQDSLEEVSADPKADHAKDTDEMTQLEESKSSLDTDISHVLEHNEPRVCTVMENTLGVFSDVVTVPLPEHRAPAAASTQGVLQDEKKTEEVNSHENQAHYKPPLPNRHLEQAPPRSNLCHYELAESLPHEKINEVTGEWVQRNPDIFSSPPPLPFKEAHVNSHSFLTTEQLLAPFTPPDQTLIFPPDKHDKFKDFPSEAYQQIMPQNILASKVKFTFPPTAIQPPNSPLQPVPLQLPLCSTSITTIHHTVLQQHAAASLKVLQPHQQFLSQVPALSRAPLPHVPVGPRLCPGVHTAFVTAPHLPLLPPSVLPPSPPAFPLLPHTVFPSLLSPHPTVIPLQPLF